MRKQCLITFEDIIAPENLLQAWQEFCRGKRKAFDVQKFERNLVDNLLALHEELENGTYRHGGYYRFTINDPKPRVIHKASVRDRLVHHALYRKLYPFFDRTFIADSYSCRLKKGTHRAMNRFRQFAHQLSANDTKTVWVLKCDIRKFFDSIDQNILLALLSERIADKKVFSLLQNIIQSFSTPVTASTRSSPGLEPGLDCHGVPRNDRGEEKMCSGGIGLPLGNLTSQLLVNIYMNEFDQWVKHRLRVVHYVRYADDFLFLAHDRQKLIDIIPNISNFLNQRLHLTLHPIKLFLNTVSLGMDFLGWVHFPRYRVIREVAKRRMMKIIMAKPESAVFDSYRGLLGHGNAHQLIQEVENLRGLFLRSH
ncbi:MAG: reverse transcriptase/maturase family protein [bacterium]|nr:reverse transcriptase/maturase family protein [bacterium]